MTQNHRTNATLLTQAANSWPSCIWKRFHPACCWISQPSWWPSLASCFRKKPLCIWTKTIINLRCINQQPIKSKSLARSMCCWLMVVAGCVSQLTKVLVGSQFRSWPAKWTRLLYTVFYAVCMGWDCPWSQLYVLISRKREWTINVATGVLRMRLYKRKTVGWIAVGIWLSPGRNGGLIWLPRIGS